MDRLDRGLALPALAAGFAGHAGAMLGDGGGEFLGQVKIATDAAFVGTIDAEHGSGIGEIGFVSDLTILGDTCGVVETEVDGQRLQLLKFRREAGGIFHPLAFLLTIFETGTGCLSIHGYNSVYWVAKQHTTKAVHCM